jgi:energy-coupling factor transporter ATPase
VPGSDKKIINIKGLGYYYKKEGKVPEYVLDGIDLSIGEGEYVAVIGANGSGKSTLLKHMNGILIPARGDVWVSGLNTRDPLNMREIHGTVGMVFQDPEAQIVATIVEEDAAFGPENLGVPREEIRRRVDWALDTVGLWGLKDRPSHLLSAGQKQQLAIASALSMKTKCLVLDEASSMLDPSYRLKILDTISRLHSQGITIVSATHNMDEAAMAQRVIVLSKGRVAMEGSPVSVFTYGKDKLKSLKLGLPVALRIAMKIAEFKKHFPVDILSATELVEEVSKHCGRGSTVNQV